jgi:hypothetical protein
MAPRTWRLLSENEAGLTKVHEQVTPLLRIGATTALGHELEWLERAEAVSSTLRT